MKYDELLRKTTLIESIESITFSAIYYSKYLYVNQAYILVKLLEQLVRHCVGASVVVK